MPTFQNNRPFSALIHIYKSYVCFNYTIVLCFTIMQILSYLPICKFIHFQLPFYIVTLCE